MSIEAMMFILGSLLVPISLIGSELKVTYTKTHAINQISRLLAVIAGLVLVLWAIYRVILIVWVTYPSAHGTNTASNNDFIERQTFPEPMYQEFRLGACYKWTYHCNERPASEWCKSKEFLRAVDFSIENVGLKGIAARPIDSKIICQTSFCSAFKFITCER